jgi:hypothetical protein
MVCLLICFLYVHIYNKINCELMLTYDTPAYMFNMYKNQLSRQTGSRNLTGPKTLPTIWHTYMKLVIKYQISAINSCWEKLFFLLIENSRVSPPWNLKYFYTPAPPEGGGYTVLPLSVLPSVQDIFCRIFLSNYWTIQIPTSCLPT